jgi:hypothetical protein
MWSSGYAYWYKRWFGMAQCGDTTCGKKSLVDNGDDFERMLNKEEEE